VGRSASIRMRAKGRVLKLRFLWRWRRVRQGRGRSHKSVNRLGKRSRDLNVANLRRQTCARPLASFPWFRSAPHRGARAALRIGRAIQSLRCRHANGNDVRGCGGRPLMGSATARPKFLHKRSGMNLRSG